MPNGGTVHARPTKAFFVDMITRDLTVTDCILDLIDNAIDHAVLQTHLDVMDRLTTDRPPLNLNGTVSVAASPEVISIIDTCGGISVPDARDRVFMFGNPGTSAAPAGLSVYGIGMKRAFFKLGRAITVESSTEADSFRLSIDVDRWLAEGDDTWNFEFTEARDHPWGSTDAFGTKITINKLRPEISQRVSEVAFRAELRSRLASTYSLFIKAGLRLTLDGDRVDPSLPTVGITSGLRPARKLFRTDSVDILIVAGITPKDDRVARGWYVFCNGRLVLGPDRTRLTGWGDKLPQWHVKYSHFIGCVYFHAADVNALPWTTTKQGVVLESTVYQVALSEMQGQSRPVLAFLNKLYPGEVPAEPVAERELLERADSVSIDQMSRADARFDARVAPKKPPGARLVSIQYRRPVKQLDRIRERLGDKTLAARRIGEHTFDYFITQECE